MIGTLKDETTTARMIRVLESLDEAGVAPFEWASSQYVARVITAMAHDTVDDELVARRYATLRLMDVLLEHRHNLLPAGPADFMDPRARVLPLAIGESVAQCEPWLDILEYMQLLNWKRKKIHSNPDRERDLKQKIVDNFSYDLVAEIHSDTEEWWITAGRDSRRD